MPYGQQPMPAGPFYFPMSMPMRPTAHYHQQQHYSGVTGPAYLPINHPHRVPYQRVAQPTAQPQQRQHQPRMKPVNICTNCNTTETSLWRRNREGRVECK